MQQALQLIPRAVVLAPDEYEKLLDQIEQLKRRLKPDKPESPSACRISGRIDGSVAHIQAKFDIRTRTPRALVNLACHRAWPTAASLDGQLPWIQTSDEGYVVQIDQPGTHQATLDFVLPVTARRGSNGDQGFELDLPRSAITMLEQFDLPPGSVEVRLGGQVIRPREGDRISRLPIPSGDHLEMAWRGKNAEAGKGPGVLAAAGRLVVRVEQSNIVTDAELLLQMLQGQVAQWQVRLRLPPEATFDVRPDPQDESRLQAITRSEDKNSPTVTVRLREPSADPFRLIFRIRQPLKGNAVSIPSLETLNAISQNGEIELRAPENIRLHYELGNTVSQRSLSDEQRREGARAAFSYWNLPSPATNSTGTFLTLQAEAIKGAAETHVSHSLRMVKTASGELSFEARTMVDVTPIRTAIDHLELVLPPDYHYDKNEGPSPVELVEDVLLDSSGQRAIVKLAQKQSRPFSFSITGSYAIARGQKQLSPQLPRAVAWGSERVPSGTSPAAPANDSLPVLDRGGKIKLTLLEGLELTAKGFRLSSDPASQNTLQSFLSPLRGKTASKVYTWQGEQTPREIALAWQEYRPELSVHSVADVMLTSQEAQVRHRLQFQSPQSNLAQVLLRVPAGLRGKVRMITGGTLQKLNDENPAELAVNFARPAPKEQVAELEYAFPLPDWVEIGGAAKGISKVRNGPASTVSTAHVRRFLVPLVQAVSASGGDIKVRVWCDPEEHAASAGEQWEDLPSEVVPDRDSLPALVLEGGLDRSLWLSITRAPLASAATALIDRILIRVDTSESGVQSYRSKFLLGQRIARELIVDLPASLSRAAVEVRLGSKAVPFQLLDEAGRETEVGKRFRFKLQTDPTRPADVLEIKYEVDAARLAGNGAMQSTYYPPQIQNALLLGRLRWDIHLPAGWMAVRSGSTATPEEQWGWSGWTLAPLPALSSSALEQWVQKSDRVSPNGERASSYLAWQTGPEPLQLAQVPRRAWMLLCSLVALAIGFILLFAPLSRLVFWFCLFAVGLSGATLEFLWPGALAAVAVGCEPGFLVLLLFVAIYAAFQHRSRHRVVLMPGFTRLKSSSSSIVSGETTRRREPAPVSDSPKRGSSVSREVRA
jgi:hypothetical protein